MKTCDFQPYGERPCGKQAAEEATDASGKVVATCCHAHASELAGDLPDAEWQPVEEVQS